MAASAESAASTVISWRSRIRARNARADFESSTTKARFDDISTPFDTQRIYGKSSVNGGAARAFLDSSRPKSDVIQCTEEVFGRATTRTLPNGATHTRSVEVS